ncbi:hypothetical protein B0H11DRAFT_1922359 [Mycena galericulata]|nr:hypothetical protein B0H11DRAFT_1922359 [Mycena galericulata]
MQIRRWMPLGKGPTYFTRGKTHTFRDDRVGQLGRRTPHETERRPLPYRQGNVVWRAKAGRLIVVHPKRRQEHERWSSSVDPGLIKSTSSRETSPRMSRLEAARNSHSSRGLDHEETRLLRAANPLYKSVLWTWKLEEDDFGVVVED